MYDVYVKADEIGHITAINSDAFLLSNEGWTKIDEGYGDRYHHAQGNYFPAPIYDHRGIPRYKLFDGKPVERTREEMDVDYVPPVPVPTPSERIAELEAENKLLHNQIGALTAQNDFHEDLIVELANIVYA